MAHRNPILRGAVTNATTGEALKDLELREIVVNYDTGRVGIVVEGDGSVSGNPYEGDDEDTDGSSGDTGGQGGDTGGGTGPGGGGPGGDTGGDTGGSSGSEEDEDEDEDDYVAEKYEYYGTWIPYFWTKDGYNWAEYITINEDGTYTLWEVANDAEGNLKYADSNKGSWSYNEDGSITLTAEYYYYTTTGEFVYNPYMGFGLTCKINSEGSLHMTSWWGNGEEYDKGTYIRYSSESTSGNASPFFGVWIPSWASGNNITEYIIVESNGTFYLWNDNYGSHTDSEEGQWQLNEDGSLTLTASYWYDSSSGRFQYSGPSNYGLTLYLNNDGTLTIYSWWDGGTGTYNKGTYILYEKDPTEGSSGSTGGGDSGSSGSGGSGPDVGGDTGGSTGGSSGSTSSSPYSGLWEPESWQNSTGWSEYVVIDDDGTFYLIYANYYNSGYYAYSGSYKGYWEATDDTTYILYPTYNYNQSDDSWTYVGDMGFGYKMVFMNEGEADLQQWWGDPAYASSTGIFYKYSTQQFSLPAISTLEINKGDNDSPKNIISTYSIREASEIVDGKMILYTAWTFGGNTGILMQEIEDWLEKNGKI